MKTVVALLPLIVCSAIAWKVSLTVRNVMGFPGALIAWGTSDRFQSIAGVLRFFLGVMVSTVGQSYVYLAFVAFIMNLTKTALHGGGVLGTVLWPVAFIASFMPAYLCAAAAIGDARGGEWNAQVVAINLTEVLAVIAFFLFAFFPFLIALG